MPVGQGSRDLQDLQVVMEIVQGRSLFMGDFSPHKSQMMSPRKISDDVFVGKNQKRFKE